MPILLPFPASPYTPTPASTPGTSRSRPPRLRYGSPAMLMAPPPRSYLHTRCLSRLQLHPPLEVRRPGHAALQQAGGQAVLSGEAAHDDGAQLLGVTCEEVRCNIMPGLVRHMFQLEGQHQVALWRSD